MALDESGEQTILWGSGMVYGGGPVLKFVDTGHELKLLGSPISALAESAGEIGLSYIADVAVLGGNVLTQHPSFGNNDPRSLAFSAETGEPVGRYIPKKADAETTENVWSLQYGEVTSGKDGNMYYHADSHMIRRYDASGSRLPFHPEQKDEEGNSDDGFVTGLWHGHTRGAGKWNGRSVF
jgi:hypothetical protein